MTQRGQRSRFPRIGGSYRRKVSWDRGPRGDLASTAGGVQLFTTAVQAAVDDLTVVRVRGELLISLLAASTVGSFMSFAFGMCIVTENAFGVGVTAVPAPFSDGAWDGWLVHLQGTVLAQTADPNGGNSDSYRAIIDSKAMRKTHQTDVMIGVIEWHDEVGVVSVESVLQTRHLSKLP